ncbi:HAD-IA family hydrolase [Kitasatospora sp. NPDC048365]|uniref:HAD-IA family hydrolase n=1 Tax=Kitasatospora sp. NPDC048365 TaxID=3364050 RepID=UPI003721603E
MTADGAGVGRPGALVCDLDGVLRLWDAADLTALDRAYGLAAGTLAGAAFREERLVPAVTGRVTDEEWRAAVAADLAGPCGSAERSGELVERWGRQPARVDERVLALLNAAARRMPVALLTNATTRLEADLAALGLDTALDATVVSTARIGVAKPDPRAYLAAAERLGVAPRRCLFVDDTAANLPGARAVGMAVHHYRHVDGLRALLEPSTG